MHLFWRLPAALKTVDDIKPSAEQLPQDQPADQVSEEAASADDSGAAKALASLSEDKKTQWELN